MPLSSILLNNSMPSQNNENSMNKGLADTYVKITNTEQTNESVNSLKVIKQGQQLKSLGSIGNVGGVVDGIMGKAI